MSFNIKVIDLVLKHQNKSKSDVNTETRLFENKSKSSIQQTLPMENNDLHIFYLNNNNRLNIFKNGTDNKESDPPEKLERLMGPYGNDIHLPNLKTIQMQGHEAMEPVSNPPKLSAINLNKVQEVLDIMYEYN